MDCRSGHSGERATRRTTSPEILRLGGRVLCRVARPQRFQDFRRSLVAALLWLHLALMFDFHRPELDLIEDTAGHLGSFADAVGAVYRAREPRLGQRRRCDGCGREGRQPAGEGAGQVVPGHRVARRRAWTLPPCDGPATASAELLPPMPITRRAEGTRRKSRMRPGCFGGGETRTAPHAVGSAGTAPLTLIAPFHTVSAIKKIQRCQ